MNNQRNKKISIFVTKGKNAHQHDIRKTITGNNVDKSLTKDNVVLRDVLKGESIEEYTNRQMQPIIDSYNQKQKRKDRIIEDKYSDYHNKNLNRGKYKTLLSHEFVIGYGSHKDIGKQYYGNQHGEIKKNEIREEMIKFYSGLVEYIQGRFKHLNILYAVIHFDEPGGTPHLHTSIQGIGEGYKKGLEKRISMSKALSLDGIEKIQNRLESIDKNGMYGEYQVPKFINIIKNEYMIPELERLGYEITQESHGLINEKPNEYQRRVEKEKAKINELITTNKDKLLKDINPKRALLNSEQVVISKEKFDMLINGQADYKVVEQLTSENLGLEKRNKDLETKLKKSHSLTLAIESERNKIKELELKLERLEVYEKLPIRANAFNKLELGYDDNDFTLKDVVDNISPENKRFIKMSDQEKEGIIIEQRMELGKSNDLNEAELTKDTVAMIYSNTNIFTTIKKVIDDILDYGLELLMRQKKKKDKKINNIIEKNRILEKEKNDRDNDERIR